MYSSVHIFPPLALSAEATLPISKSDSNRLAILAALSGADLSEIPLSTAADTQLLLKGLTSISHTVYCADAGTTIRFLCAYFYLKNRPAILTCSEGMKRRPIGPLVEALRIIGAEIDYLEKEGYPPLEIKGRTALPEKAILSIDGSLSSQFSSALLLIAPFFPQGMELELVGEQSSSSYIDLTLSSLSRARQSYRKEGQRILVSPWKGPPLHQANAESDWSSASYWYGMIALSAIGESLLLPGLRLDSAQGDRIAAQYFEYLGVNTSERPEGISIAKVEAPLLPILQFNFRQCPDLCPAIVLTCAALGQTLLAEGLQTLPLKESHRILALGNLLKSMNVTVETDETSYLRIQGKAVWYAEKPFPVFKDHRMAMSLAMLGRTQEIRIADPMVVKKSFPEFWKAFAQSGFKLIFC